MQMRKLFRDYSIATDSMHWCLIHMDDRNAYSTPLNHLVAPYSNEEHHRDETISRRRSHFGRAARRTQPSQGASNTTPVYMPAGPNINEKPSLKTFQNSHNQVSSNPQSMAGYYQQDRRIGVGFAQGLRMSILILI